MKQKVRIAVLVLSLFASPACKPLSVPDSHHSAKYCHSCIRDSKGKIARSYKAKKAFMVQTGFPDGREGYVVDHITPLYRGGKDSPENMQWQTIEEAKEKDKTE